MSTSREKELARQRAERQAARRAADAARKRQRTAVIGAVLAVLLVSAGLGALVTVLGDDAPEDTVAAQPSASAAAAAGPCAYPPAGEPSKELEAPPPTEGVETSGIWSVTLKTSEGDVSFDMDAAKTPCTANSFRALTHFGFFDDTPCHRLVTEGIFVLQCGDPTGTGTGGPGYRFADEDLEGATYPRGTVAMANSGPGTNGSQFFLVYQDSPLPADYTPFGTITSGLDVLEAVAAGGAEDASGQPAPDGSPVIPVQIDDVVAKKKA